MDNRSRSTSCKLNSYTTRVINTILYCGSCSIWVHHRRKSGLKSIKLPQEQADRIKRVRWAVATPIVLCSYHKCLSYNFTTRQSFLPLTLVIFEWSLTSIFQSLAFLRKDCPPNLNEFQQSKLHITLKWYQQEGTVNIRTYTRAYKSSWNMEKWYTFYFLKKLFCIN